MNKNQKSVSHFTKARTPRMVQKQKMAIINYYVKKRNEQNKNKK